MQLQLQLRPDLCRNLGLARLYLRLGLGLLLMCNYMLRSYSLNLTLHVLFINLVLIPSILLVLLLIRIISRALLVVLLVLLQVPLL